MPLGYADVAGLWRGRGKQGWPVANPAPVPPPRAWSGKGTMTSLRGLVLAEQLQTMALLDLGILVFHGSHPTVCLVSWESKWRSHVYPGASLVPAAKLCYKEEARVAPCQGGEVCRQLAIACLPQKSVKQQNSCVGQLPDGSVRLTKPEEL